MKLTVQRLAEDDYRYRVIMHHGGKYASMRYDEKPTFEEIVEFVNNCGKQLDGVEAAA